jgi:exonuclease III
MLTKIPTKWLPQILDDIIDHQENSTHSGEFDKDEIKGLDTDISICKLIKRSIEGIASISFNDVEQELRFLDILVDQKIYEEGIVMQLKGSDDEEEQEWATYAKSQLKILNKYIRLIDPDRARRRMLKAKHAKEYEEYKAKEKKEALETVRSTHTRTAE